MKKIKDKKKKKMQKRGKVKARSILLAGGNTISPPLPTPAQRNATQPRGKR